MPCNRCFRWTREYRWFSIYLPDGPDQRWGRTYWRDPQEEGLWWYLVCYPLCELTAARDLLAEAEQKIAQAREVLEWAVSEVREALEEVDSRLDTRESPPRERDRQSYR